LCAKKIEKAPQNEARFQPLGDRGLGQLLSESPKNTGGWKEKNIQSCGNDIEPQDRTPALSEMGVDKKLSARSKSITGQGVTYPGAKRHKGGYKSDNIYRYPPALFFMEKTKGGMKGLGVT